MTKLVLMTKNSLQHVGKISYVNDLLIEIILGMTEYLQQNKLVNRNIQQQDIDLDINNVKDKSKKYITETEIYEGQLQQVKYSLNEEVDTLIDLLDNCLIFNDTWEPTYNHYQLNKENKDIIEETGVGGLSANENGFVVKQKPHKNEILINYEYLFQHSSFIIKTTLKYNLLGAWNFIWIIGHDSGLKDRDFEGKFLNNKTSKSNNNQIEFSPDDSSLFVDALYLISPYIHSKYFIDKQKVPWNFYLFNLFTKSYTKKLPLMVKFI